jgi:hypothetical protein
VDDFQLLILLFGNVPILWYFVFMFGLTYSRVGTFIYVPATKWRGHIVLPNSVIPK